MKLWTPSNDSSESSQSLSPIEQACRRIYSQVAGEVQLSPLDSHFQQLRRTPVDYWLHFRGGNWPRYSPLDDVIETAFWGRVETMIKFCNTFDCEARPYKSLGQWVEIEKRIAERAMQVIMGNQKEYYYGG